MVPPGASFDTLECVLLLCERADEAGGEEAPGTGGPVGRGPPPPGCAPLPAVLRRYAENCSSRALPTRACLCALQTDLGGHDIIPSPA